MSSWHCVRISSCRRLTSLRRSLTSLWKACRRSSMELLASALHLFSFSLSAALWRRRLNSICRSSICLTRSERMPVSRLRRSSLPDCSSNVFLRVETWARTSRVACSPPAMRVSRLRNWSSPCKARCSSKLPDMDLCRLLCWSTISLLIDFMSRSFWEMLRLRSASATSRSVLDAATFSRTSARIFSHCFLSSAFSSFCLSMASYKRFDSVALDSSIWWDSSSTCFSTICRCRSEEDVTVRRRSCTSAKASSCLLICLTRPSILFAS
mmetsp:Transcript_6719/g.25979  ORF Transcript_6719/g.25979 Transcript_6719/m.25979 type:complete len:267 (+) Transcript_6719:1526-2326(+)